MAAAEQAAKLAAAGIMSMACMLEGLWFTVAKSALVREQPSSDEECARTIGRIPGNGAILRVDRLISIGGDHYSEGWAVLHQSEHKFLDTPADTAYVRISEAHITPVKQELIYAAEKQLGHPVFDPRLPPDERAKAAVKKLELSIEEKDKRDREDKAMAEAKENERISKIAAKAQARPREVTLEEMETLLDALAGTSTDDPGELGGGPARALDAEPPHSDSIGTTATITYAAPAGPSRPPPPPRPEPDSD